MLILDFLHYLSNLSNQTVGYLWCNVVFLHPCSLHSENMSYNVKIKKNIFNKKA